MSAGGQAAGVGVSSLGSTMKQLGLMMAEEDARTAAERRDRKLRREMADEQFQQQRILSKENAERTSALNLANQMTMQAVNAEYTTNEQIRREQREDRKEEEERDRQKLAATKQKEEAAAKQQREASVSHFFSPNALEQKLGENVAQKKDLQKRIEFWEKTQKEMEMTELGQMPPTSKPVTPLMPGEEESSPFVKLPEDPQVLSPGMLRKQEDKLSADRARWQKFGEYVEDEFDELEWNNPDAPDIVDMDAQHIADLKDQIKQLDADRYDMQYAQNNFFETVQTQGAGETLSYKLLKPQAMRDFLVKQGFTSEEAGERVKLSIDLNKAEIDAKNEIQDQAQQKYAEDQETYRDIEVAKIGQDKSELSATTTSDKDFYTRAATLSKNSQKQYNEIMTLFGEMDFNTRKANQVLSNLKTFVSEIPEMDAAILKDYGEGHFEKAKKAFSIGKKNKKETDTQFTARLKESGFKSAKEAQSWVDGYVGSILSRMQLLRNSDYASVRKKVEHEYKGPDNPRPGELTPPGGYSAGGKTFKTKREAATAYNKIRFSPGWKDLSNSAKQQWLALRSKLEKK
jgi:hypothetical protein